MLSDVQKRKVLHTLQQEVGFANSDIDRDYMSIIISETLYISEITEIAKLMDFHIVDTSSLSRQKMSTTEFCNFIKYDDHGRFILKIPRIVPFPVCMFLNWVCDQQIIHTESSYGSGGNYIPYKNKAFCLLMTKDDFDEVELETGWSRNKLDRVVVGHCWIIDS